MTREGGNGWCGSRRRGATRASPATTAVAAVASITLAAMSGGSPAPARVPDVPHSEDPAQQARDLAAWLKRYSR